MKEKVEFVFKFSNLKNYFLEFSPILRLELAHKYKKFRLKLRAGAKKNKYF